MLQIGQSILSSKCMMEIAWSSSSEEQLPGLWIYFHVCFSFPLIYRLRATNELVWTTYDFCKAMHMRMLYLAKILTLRSERLLPLMLQPDELRSSWAQVIGDGSKYVMMYLLYWKTGTGSFEGECLLQINFSDHCLPCLLFGLVFVA